MPPILDVLISIRDIYLCRCCPTRFFYLPHLQPYAPRANTQWHCFIYKISFHGLINTVSTTLHSRNLQAGTSCIRPLSFNFQSPRVGTSSKSGVVSLISEDHIARGEVASSIPLPEFQKESRENLPNMLDISEDALHGDERAIQVLGEPHDISNGTILTPLSRNRFQHSAFRECDCRIFVSNSL